MGSSVASCTCHAYSQGKGAWAFDACWVGCALVGICHPLLSVYVHISPYIYIYIYTTIHICICYIYICMHGCMHIYGSFYEPGVPFWGLSMSDPMILERPHICWEWLGLLHCYRGWQPFGFAVAWNLRGWPMEHASHGQNSLYRS